MSKKIISLIGLCCIISGAVLGQQLTGTLYGSVVDYDTEAPLEFVTIVIADSTLTIGTITDDQGLFELRNIPVGRHNIRVSMVGFEPQLFSNVLISSGVNASLNVKLKERPFEMEEITVQPKQIKEQPVNRIAKVSAKRLSMEEANRFAGGFDDPARLVSSFAGVASNIGTNEIIIRGNSPKGILWRLEGVNISNPNHFADISGFGGGGVTALSSKMLSNSDFFTGAFPAEYGNAMSGVFDLSLREGNTREYEHSFLAGFMGLDFASEGPIKKNSGASYLFNYRYSTFGLLNVILPNIDLGIKYQDLAFNINLPTGKAGTFSVWGLGLIDESSTSPDDDTLNSGYKWQYYEDLLTEDSNFKTGIIGISNKLLLNGKGYLKTSISGSVNEINHEGSQLDSTFTTNYPVENIQFSEGSIQVSSTLNYTFGSRHTNRTGIVYNNLSYNYLLQEAQQPGEPMVTFANDNGSSYLMQAFSQSSLTFGNLEINPGLHFMYFGLNGEQSLEPRIGASYQINPKNSLRFGFGIHSQLEKLSFYLSDIPTTNGTDQLNKALKLSKSQHFVLAYDRLIGNHTHLVIEPYYQYLYDIPVIDGTYFSMLNLSNDFFINEALISEGTGSNIGVDVTLERFLNKGWYYLATLSVFNSEFVGGDGIKRSTRFNRNHISNLLLGKEWMVKDKNIFSASIKYTYLGGSLIHPVDEAASLEAKEAIDDLSSPYSERTPDSNIASLTLTYRVNRVNYSSHWSLQLLNMLGAKEYLGYQYNFREHSVDYNDDTIFVPNFSYRIDF